jgi:hypothetical protein
MKFNGMLRLLTASIFVVACAMESLYAQPTFDLSFNGPGTLSGSDGSSVSQAYDCILTPGGALDNKGAQGWSISLTSSGAAVTGITTEGTIGAEVAQGGLRNTGFEKSELTVGAGNEGAVSAVVLSFTLPITAPLDVPSRIAVVTVDATITDGGSATLSFVDNRRGSGQPVENNVTWDGKTIKPSLTAKTIGLAVSQSCPDNGAVQINLDAPGISVPDPSAPAQIVASPGVAIIDVLIVSSEANGLESGVQGWSLSLGVGGDVTLVSATTEGTVGAEVAQGGLRNTGFEKTEVVNPELNGQGQGAVSAVVLSFTLPIVLPPTGSAVVLKLGVEGALGAAGTVSGVDGLVGAGQPVDNVATVGGKTVTYSCIQSANIVYDAPPVQRFRPGNANSDLRLDIADPIWIINELFREGTPSSCRAATDANGDGLIDLSDATFLINYLFFSGAAPSSLDCIEVGDDTLDCEVGQDICSG